MVQLPSLGRVNWAHPITRGLRVAAINGNPQNLVSGELAIISGNPPMGPNSVTFDGNNFDHLKWTFKSNPTDRTLFLMFRYSSLYVSNPYSYLTSITDNSEGSYIGIRIDTSTGMIQAYEFTGGVETVDTEIMNYGHVYAIAQSIESGVDLRIAVNGKIYTKGSAGTGYTGWPDGPFINTASQGSAPIGDHFMVLAWDRALSTTELQLLTLNPSIVLTSYPEILLVPSTGIPPVEAWGLFRPQPIFEPTNVAAY